MTARRLRQVVVEQQLQHHAHGEILRRLPQHLRRGLLPTLAPTTQHISSPPIPPHTDRVALVLRRAHVRRRHVQRKPVVQDAERVLVQRLLALRTTLHCLVQHLLGAHGTRVEARVAQEVPEVPVVRAVEVNLLDLGLHALRVIPAEHDHLNPVEEANKPVHEAVRLQRLQLPDREEVVVVVGVFGDVVVLAVVVMIVAVIVEILVVVILFVWINAANVLVVI